ncbi:hypothetical protein RRG08_047409 [Elysia crispata]|uniref:Uncharacterized protein n=1 Tax=Elysia crispata TaxID=231223 RepID=A0AAE0YUB9_9GAST|nr:hypothetical protein RRG08_047409 [Elysia crispata]
MGGVARRRKYTGGVGRANGCWWKISRPHGVTGSSRNMKRLKSFLPLKELNSASGELYEGIIKNQLKTTLIVWASNGDTRGENGASNTKCDLIQENQNHSNLETHSYQERVNKNGSRWTTPLGRMEPSDSGPSNLESSCG